MSERMPSFLRQFSKETNPEGRSKTATEFWAVRERENRNKESEAILDPEAREIVSGLNRAGQQIETLRQKLDFKL
ncbi:hypothetical protein KJ673_00785 [Patescibacteria group bacterium]|nr:hypothetical protein [Patescibacteria group bacterium]